MGIVNDETDYHRPAVTSRMKIQGIFAGVSSGGEEKNSFISIKDEGDRVQQLGISVADVKAIMEKGLRKGEKVSALMEKTECCKDHSLESPYAASLERYSEHAFRFSFDNTYCWLPMHTVEEEGRIEKVVAFYGQTVASEIEDDLGSGRTVNVILPVKERERLIAVWSKLAEDVRTVTMTMSCHSMTEIQPNVFRVDAPESERVIFNHPTPRRGSGMMG